MFVVSETDAAAIQAAFAASGELAAGVEVRRRYPGITDLAEARRCARIILGWVLGPDDGDRLAASQDTRLPPDDVAKPLPG